MGLDPGSETGSDYFLKPALVEKKKEDPDPVLPERIDPSLVNLRPYPKSFHL